MDADADMVAYARGEGLDVEQADLVAHLESLEDGSLGGVFAAQVVEHLPPPVLLRFLELAAREAPSGRRARRPRRSTRSRRSRCATTSPTSRTRSRSCPRRSRCSRGTRASREVEMRFLNAPEPAEGADPRLNEIVFAPLDYAILAGDDQPNAHEHKEGQVLRIAVCRPRCRSRAAGAEILAERLTEELRERGHEADLVTVPFKWYPAERVLTQAFLVAAARPRGGGRAAGRPRDRDEVPLVRRAPPEQGRVARAPVPPGLRARPHRARPVRRVAGRAGAAAEAPRARPSHSRRGAAALLDLAKRRRAPRALRSGSRRRSCCRRRRRSTSAASATTASSSP